MRRRFAGLVAIAVATMSLTGAWASQSYQRLDGRSALPSREEAVAELTLLLQDQVRQFQDQEIEVPDAESERVRAIMIGHSVTGASAITERLEELGATDAAGDIAESLVANFEDFDPDSLEPIAAYNLAQLYRLAGDNQRSRQWLGNAFNAFGTREYDHTSAVEVVADYGDTIVRTNIAQAFFDLGDQSSALDVYRAELDRGGDYHPLVFNGRARAARWLAAHGAPFEALQELHELLVEASNSPVHPSERGVNPIPDTLVVLGIIGTDQAMAAHEAIIRSNFLSIDRLDMRIAEAQLYRDSGFENLAQRALRLAVVDLLERDDLSQLHREILAIGAPVARTGMCDLALALRDLAATAEELDQLQTTTGDYQPSPTMVRFEIADRLNLAIIEANCGSVYEVARAVTAELQQVLEYRRNSNGVDLQDDDGFRAYAFGSWLSSIEASTRPERHDALLRAISTTVPVQLVQTQAPTTYGTDNFALARIWVEGSHLSGRRHLAEDVALETYRSLPAEPTARINALVEMMPMFR
nr:hypothetical protein [Nitrosomonas nitrosa]